MMFPREHISRWRGSGGATRLQIRRGFEMVEADYFTAHEAAERLGYRVQHVRRLLRSGKLVGEKFGRDWVVQRESVEQYLVRREYLDLPLSEEGES